MGGNGGSGGSGGTWAQIGAPAAASIPEIKIHLRT
jgi:hypothetical protein